MAHDRTLDHYGTEDTTTAVLSAAIGQYPAGTSLQTVLEGMLARIATLEAVPITWHSVLSNAVVKKTTSSSFTANAISSAVTRTPTFIAYAYMQSVQTATPTLTANATIIDLVEC